MAEKIRDSAELALIFEPPLDSLPSPSTTPIPITSFRRFNFRLLNFNTSLKGKPTECTVQFTLDYQYHRQPQIYPTTIWSSATANISLTVIHSTLLKQPNNLQNGVRTGPSPARMLQLYVHFTFLLTLLPHRLRTAINEETCHPTTTPHSPWYRMDKTATYICAHRYTHIFSDDIGTISLAQMEFGFPHRFPPSRQNCLFSSNDHSGVPSILFDCCFNGLSSKTLAHTLTYLRR